MVLGLWINLLIFLLSIVTDKGNSQPDATENQIFELRFGFVITSSSHYSSLAIVCSNGLECKLRKSPRGKENNSWNNKVVATCVRNLLDCQMYSVRWTLLHIRLLKNDVGFIDIKWFKNLTICMLQRSFTHNTCI